MPQDSSNFFCQFPLLVRVFLFQRWLFFPPFKKLENDNFLKRIFSEKENDGNYLSFFRINPVLTG